MTGKSMGAQAARPGLPGRIASIDRFRGLAILAMAIADFGLHVESLPAWLRHAPDPGLTVIDLVAPLFVFAIGLTYGLSFRRRLARDGAASAYWHFAARYLALLGLGALITSAGVVLGIRRPTASWGLLEALGAAGLLTLVVIRLHPWPRLAAGLSLLAVYQVLLDRFWLDRVVIAIHDGPWGALSWGAMLIVATALADLHHGERPCTRSALALYAALFLGAGAALSFVVPAAKTRASVSYVVLTLGISALLFVVLDAITCRRRGFLLRLEPWGRNALALYIAHGALLGVFALPPARWWYHSAPLWLTALQLTAFLAALHAVARFLDRRGWYAIL